MSDRLWKTGAALGPSETYVGNRLLFRGADHLESPMLSSPDLRIVGWVVARSFIISGLLMTACLAGGLCICFGGLGAASSSANAGDGTGGLNSLDVAATGMTSALAIGAVLSVVAFLASLILPYRQLVSEWHLVLDDHADLAESAYTSLYGNLAFRRLPLTTWRPRWAHDPAAPGRLVRRLAVGDRRFTAYVSVFGHGRDLYTGWQLWRSDLGIQLLGLYIKSWFITPGQDLKAALAADRVRALRDAVHSAVRTAVETAASDQVMRFADQFPGVEPPIETIGPAPQGLPPISPVPHPTHARPAPPTTPGSLS